MAVPFMPRGAWTALVTPFEKNGKLDMDAYKRLIEFQIDQGINGLVPAGTTGESPTLTWEEHNAVIEMAIRMSDDRVGVLAGTGSNSSDEAVHATKHAREAGASAVLLVDCYYNKPSSLELRTEYYESVLEWVPEIPLVPYVIPGRSVTALSAADLAIMHAADPQRVPAVKQATGDFERMRQDRALAGITLSIMSGDDDLTLAMMQDEKVGCSGAISVMTNLVPAAIVKMVEAQTTGDAATAKDIAAKLDPLFKLVGCTVQNERELPNGTRMMVEDKFPNPLPVKAIMTALGMPSGFCRRPMGMMTKNAVDLCRQATLKVWADAPELLKPLESAFGVDIGKRLVDDAAWAAVTRP